MQIRLDYSLFQDYVGFLTPNAGVVFEKADNSPLNLKGKSKG